jgi:hypothetical protein
MGTQGSAISDVKLCPLCCPFKIADGGLVWIYFGLH